MKPNLIILFIYIGLTFIMSLISSSLFIKDKNLAKNGALRIKEKTLLGTTVFFGSLGALCGRKLAHHKTDKIYFSIVIYFSLLIQVGVLALLVYLCF